MAPTTKRVLLILGALVLLGTDPCYPPQYTVQPGGGSVAGPPNGPVANAVTLTFPSGAFAAATAVLVTSVSGEDIGIEARTIATNQMTYAFVVDVSPSPPTKPVGVAIALPAAYVATLATGSEVRLFSRRTMPVNPALGPFSGSSSYEMLEDSSFDLATRTLRATIPPGDFAPGGQARVVVAMAAVDAAVTGTADQRPSTGLWNIRDGNGGTGELISHSTTVGFDAISGATGSATVHVQLGSVVGSAGPVVVQTINSGNVATVICAITDPNYGVFDCSAPAADTEVRLVLASEDQRWVIDIWRTITGGT